MLAEFAKKGVEIKKIYHCPHLEGCECRKPKPGMILKAQAEFDIDLANSIFIGDNITDMESGKNAGVKTLCLVQEIDTQSDKKSEFSSEIQVKNEKGSEFKCESSKGFEFQSKIQAKNDENSSKNAEFYKKFSNLAEIKEFFKEKL